MSFISQADASTEAVTYAQTARRIACERCRGQKLRCIRDAGRTDPCLRCLQTQAECITSPRKAPGRTATRKQSLTDQQGLLVEGSSKGAITRSTSDASDLQTAELDTGGLEQILNSPFSFDFSPDNGSLFAPNDLLSEYGNSSSNMFLEFSDLIPEASSNWDLMMDSADTNQSASDQLHDQNADLGLQLSRLQQNLTNNLIAIKSARWTITDLLRMESTLGDFARQPHLSRSTGAIDPLSTTFNMILDFERLLAMVRNLNSTRDMQVSRDLLQETTISCPLIAFSCYVQLVLSYNYILSHIVEQSTNSHAVREFILYAGLRVSIGGHKVLPPRNLFGQLLVQVMKERIQPIEVALGLPDHHRVSKQVDQGNNEVTSDGLLSGKYGQSLLAALEGPTLEPKGRSSGSKSGIIDDLRENLAYLESFD